MQGETSDRQEGELGWAVWWACLSGSGKRASNSVVRAMTRWKGGAEMEGDAAEGAVE